ncbi:hypothetical protein [Sphingopyxis indica]|uniref:hypothetical protein n=1 Tax=Sphingopyxis indica TaxID=436663 RepID=UPI000B774026|nr:hypothetical protein [Sphingopyxis indica]
MTTSLPVSADLIRRVTFFKRDEVTSDLICCEIASDDDHWIFHEELESWELLLAEIALLPNFKTDWYERVSQPAFAPSPFIAYDKQGS